MEGSTPVSLSLTSVLKHELDMTANNIANSNTAGFKGERLSFDSFLVKSGSTETSFVIDKGSFVDDRQGPVTYTGNPLDLALQGEGWFSYKTPDGQTSYGRNGQFRVDSLGTLVTMNGDKVLDDGGGEIVFPPDTASAAIISADGTISAGGAGTIAKIGIFSLPDLQSYERIGAGRFVPPEGRTSMAFIDETTRVTQGAIEGSNVQPVLEMSRLINIQQAYQRSTKLMDGEDELRRKALQQISRNA